ncbi:MAG: UGSC family (seleno)protein [Pseudomonadota bacterium]
MRASAIVEVAGVPSASLTCEGFLGQARTTASGLGFPSLPLAKMPGHVDAQSADELRDIIVGRVTADIVKQLTEPPIATTAGGDPDPQQPVFSGSTEEVNRLFYENGWTDGLPIVPPTEERFADFMGFTARAQSDHLGVLAPEYRRITVRNVAVNGIMANCAPEYMPVLVAIAEILGDPAYGAEHSGDTTGGDALITLSGPLVDTLEFNARQAVLRDGPRANTSIGRFLRLLLRNVGGFVPGRGDMATFGHTWRVVLAESQSAIASLGWSSHAMDQGFTATDSVVTIGRYTGQTTVGSIYGSTPEQILPYLADGLAQQPGWELAFTAGMAPGSSRPMLVLSPMVAAVFANAGWSKHDVQAALFARARIPASKFERYLTDWSRLVPPNRSLVDLANLGLASAPFAEDDDPDRAVPVVAAPEHILIIVSGDPFRANAEVLTSNGMHGYPTSRKVDTSRLPLNRDP